MVGMAEVRLCPPYEMEDLQCGTLPLLNFPARCSMKHLSK